MRIAIVGSGVSGLVAAHLLHRRADLAVFEASDRIGGHVHTIDVRRDDGEWAVDTGFIVYNERNYPNFCRLLSQLGVATQPSSMSFSVRSAHPSLEYNGTTFRQLFAQRRNLLRPRFLRMLRDVVRFNAQAPEAARNGAAHASLGAYAEGAGYSDWFVHHYLVPMGSAIWSSPRDRVLEMPLPFFVEFFENHGMLTIDDRPEWRVIRGGSREYVEALVSPFRSRIRLRTPVRMVTRAADGVRVNGEAFDHVIFACHSDQALRALTDPTAAEREILGAMPYQGNDTVLHTDARLLPRRRSAWAAWNYHSDRAEGGAPVGVTYNMNILQTLDAPDPFCVTLNDRGEIDPARVLETIWYEHPLYTPGAVAAQARHAEISGVERTHYCGAYWGNGFHEDGVASALAVGRAFGAAL